VYRTALACADGLSTALAIGIYYADYLSIPGAID